MAENGIIIDVNRFKKQVDRFATKYGVDARQVMLDQMRLWTIDLIKSFPPKNSSQGKRAVKSDIQRIFIPVDSGSFAAVKEWALIVGGQELGRAFKSKTGSVYGVEKRFFDFSGDKIPAHHRRFRTKDGRVTRAGTFTRDIGRWKFVDKVVTKQSILNRYIKEKQKNVGILKAGWVPALTYFAAVSGGVFKAPVFVKKIAKSKQSGGFVDRFGKDGTGFLEAINSVPWSKRHKSILNFTLNKRKRDVSRQLKNRLEKLIAQENRATV